MRFFEHLANKPRFPYVLWQEYNDMTQFKCDMCGKEFNGGKRYLGNLKNGMYQTCAVICPDCRNKAGKPEQKEKRKPRKAELL